MLRSASVLLMMVLFLPTRAAWAQPDDFTGAIAGPRPVILCQPLRGVAALAPLPWKSKLVPLDDLQLTGPEPSHPFVLGNFAADGRWGMVRGAVGVIEGKNAAIQLAWAGDFELEGVMEQTGLGGCFWLLGCHEGHGYVLHNVVLKESGSPWFITEMRGNKAIEGRTLELEKFDWKGEQPFVLRVQNQRFSLKVGKFQVFDQQLLEAYHPGQLAFGIYDTRYGPKTIRIKSMKIQAITPEESHPVSASMKQK